MLAQEVEFEEVDAGGNQYLVFVDNTFTYEDFDKINRPANTEETPPQLLLTTKILSKRFCKTTYV